MIAWRPAAATMDQERFEVRPLIVGHQSANQGCPPQRAALNQFAILASIGLSTRPSITVVIFCWRILLISESMGHHDSEIMDDRSID